MTFFRKFLCLVGWHSWQVSGLLRLRQCRHCPVRHRWVQNPAYENLGRWVRVPSRAEGE